MIQNMGIQIDGVEFVTTTEAVELARALGHPISNQGVTAALRRDLIDGAFKMGQGNIGWLMPKAAFSEWVANRTRRGPKPKKV